MKIQAYMTTYMRFDMMIKEARHLVDSGCELMVIDDGSGYPSFKPDFTFVTGPHGGKMQFWRKYNSFFQHAYFSDADIFIFTQDDFQNLDIERVKEYHEKYCKLPYMIHLINDGRQRCWGGRSISRADGMEKLTWVDCTFFCNRAALRRLDFKVEPVPETWFTTEVKSSGVGKQLSYRTKRFGVQVYRPDVSLAYHGDHPSVMHPEIRKKVKLISK